MTLAKFDPRNITRYNKPRYLLHFQWGKSEKVYRYALVEIFNPGIIHQAKHYWKNHKKKILIGVAALIIILAIF